MVRAKNLLVTGRPGVGKTTLIERVVKTLNLPVGGFYTYEIREKGVRVGFLLRTWDGKSGILSHVEFQSPFRVGKYCVDISVMDKIGVPAILEAIRKAKLIVIDEVGRMELFSEEFKKSVLVALESSTPLLGVIQERAYPFLNQVRCRPDMQMFTVTLENRDGLVGILSKQIQGLLSGGLS